MAQFLEIPSESGRFPRRFSPGYLGGEQSSKWQAPPQKTGPAKEAQHSIVRSLSFLTIFVANDQTFSLPFIDLFRFNVYHTYLAITLFPPCYSIYLKEIFMANSMITTSFFALAVWTALPQQVPKPSDGTVKANENAAAPPKLGEEQIPQGEDESIQKLVAQQLLMMKRDPTKRGQHPKHHGFLEAEFTVNGDIPTEFKRGLFATPATYKAKIRVSNATQPKDTDKDVRGLAIKLYGVKGPRALDTHQKEEQDFVLIDSEIFLASDPKTMLAFMTALSSTEKDAMKNFALMDPDTAKRANESRKAPPASPLAIPYWSTVPYKLGDGAVKYQLTPMPGNSSSDQKPTVADGLRLALVNHLTTAKKGAEFEFSLIPQDDPVKSPVEDPTKPWHASPVPVAKIKIPPQTFDTPELMKEGEEASFDPWHALAEHRPLGGINRARKAIYPASLELRQKSRAQ